MTQMTIAKVLSFVWQKQISSQKWHGREIYVEDKKSAMPMPQL